MAMRLSVRWKKDRKLQFRLALFTGGRSLSGLVLTVKMKRVFTESDTNKHNVFHDGLS